MIARRIAAIIIIVIGVIIIILAQTIAMDKYDGNIGETKDIEVKCYDRWNNEIQGLVCNSTEIEWDMPLVSFCMLGAFLLVAGLISLMITGSGEL